MSGPTLAKIPGAPNQPRPRDLPSVKQTTSADSGPKFAKLGQTTTTLVEAAPQHFEVEVPGRSWSEQRGNPGRRRSGLVEVWANLHSLSALGWSAPKSALGIAEALKSVRGSFEHLPNMGREPALLSSDLDHGLSVYLVSRVRANHVELGQAGSRPSLTPLQRQRTIKPAGTRSPTFGRILERPMLLWPATGKFMD